MKMTGAQHDCKDANFDESISVILKCGRLLPSSPTRAREDSLRRDRAFRPSLLSMGGRLHSGARSTLRSWNKLCLSKLESPMRQSLISILYL